MAAKEPKGLGSMGTERPGQFPKRKFVKTSLASNRARAKKLQAERNPPGRGKSWEEFA